MKRRARCRCGAQAGEKRCTCPRISRVALVVVQGALLGGLVLVALTGCAAPAVVQTRVVVERVTVPAGLLTCAAEPAIGDITMQSEVADYLIQLRAAGADCRDTVTAIAKIEGTAGP